MSKPRREGYLLIDHTFSPGITQEMLQSAGLSGPIVGPDSKFESATITCLHCNAIVILNPNRSRPRGFCAKCDGYICDNPGCGLECINFEKMLDELQAQAAKEKNKDFVIINPSDLLKKE